MKFIKCKNCIYFEVVYDFVNPNIYCKKKRRVKSIFKFCFNKGVLKGDDIT